MPNRLITLRLGDKLLKEIDKVLEESSFENRTEFIRHSVRAMLKDLSELPLQEIAPKGKTIAREEELIEEAGTELRYVR